MAGSGRSPACCRADRRPRPEPHGTFPTKWLRCNHRRPGGVSLGRTRRDRSGTRPWRATASWRRRGTASPVGRAAFSSSSAPPLRAAAASGRGWSPSGSTWPAPRCGAPSAAPGRSPSWIRPARPAPPCTKASSPQWNGPSPSFPKSSAPACAGLIDLRGLTAQEAADALSCPGGTVLSRVYRGRRRLAGLQHDGIGHEA